jgi:CRP-like cAMP-binding protein
MSSESSEQKVRAFLRELPWLRRFNDDQIGDLLRCITVKGPFAPGQKIMVQGEIAKDAFILYEGELCSRVTTRSGVAKEIAGFEPGVMLGGISLIHENYVSNVDVVVVSSANIIAISKEQFNRMRQANHSAAYKLLQVICTTLCEEMRMNKLKIQSILFNESCHTHFKMTSSVERQETKSGAFQALGNFFARK